MLRSLFLLKVRVLSSAVLQALAVVSLVQSFPFPVLESAKDTNRIRTQGSAEKYLMSKCNLCNLLMIQSHV